MVAALAAFAVLLAVTGPHLASLYAASGLSDCQPAGRGNPASDFLRQLYAVGPYRVLYLLGVMLIAVTPAVIGLFWGAPLIAREVETGTSALAWGQSVTRTRWLAVKLAVGVLAAMAVPAAEEADGEFRGGHGDDGTEAAAFGDPGDPVAEHARCHRCWKAEVWPLWRFAFKGEPGLSGECGGEVGLLLDVLRPGPGRVWRLAGAPWAVAWAGQTLVPGAGPRAGRRRWPHAFARVTARHCAIASSSRSTAAAALAAGAEGGVGDRVGAGCLVRAGDVPRRRHDCGSCLVAAGGAAGS